MEEFIGFIIFIVIAGISGLAKLQEKRKEEELRRQRGNRKGVEELPEATRRMLYGDGGPPVARRRGEGPPPPVATPRAEAPRPAPQRRPVPERQQPAPAAPQRRQAPQRQQAPSAPRPVARPLQQQPVTRRQATEVKATQNIEHERERLRSVEEAARREAEYRSTDAQKPVPVKKAPRRISQAQLFRELARNKNALRASMITMEVMGPPKALR